MLRHPCEAVDLCLRAYFLPRSHEQKCTDLTLPIRGNFWHSLARSSVAADSFGLSERSG
jgi:hypothetical protein